MSDYYTPPSPEVESLRAELAAEREKSERMVVTVNALNEAVERLTRDRDAWQKRAVRALECSEADRNRVRATDDELEKSERRVEKLTAELIRYAGTSAVQRILDATSGPADGTT